MAKKSSDAGSEKAKKTTAKKTPAQKEKENKENKLAALDLIRRDRMRDKDRLDDAARALDIPDISGIDVIHRKFGEGKVIESAGKYFVVKFENKQIKMKFPDAFDKGILKLKNESDSETIDKICSMFRNLDNKKEEMDKRIYDISAEMSRINL